MSFISIQINSQELCTELLPTRDSSVFAPVNQQASINGTTYIKLYFHIYYHYDTYHQAPIGVDIQRCRDVKDLLNSQFDGTGFQFFFNECEVDSIEDRHGARGNEISDIPGYLFCQREHDDGIDIHLRADVNQANLGVASAIGGGEFIVGGNYNETDGLPISLSNSLAHEMGHCFGLYHTYAGTCLQPISGQPCEGSFLMPNSSTGDFVDDTPEDARGTVNNDVDCIYNDDPICETGSYNPITTNYMAYFGERDCSTEFTPDQIDKMHRDAQQDIRYDHPNSHDLEIEKQSVCTPTLIANVGCDENELDFIWSTGATENSIDISENGTYWVEVSDEYGHLSKETIEITDILEVDIVSETIYRSCDDSRPLFADVSGGVPPYTYQWNTGATTYEIFHNEICPTEFEVTVTDDNGCSVTKSTTSSIGYGLPDRPHLMDTDVSYNGLLHVRSELEITSTVSFTENAGILVERGGKLILNGGTLTKCEEADSWRGIIVEGNSNLEQPDPSDPSDWGSDQAGIVVTKNNAVIEYARIGIHTNYAPCDPWTDEKWGGVVYCEDTEFLHCRSGIGFMKYDFPNKSSIINCTFDGSNPVNGNSVGITVWDCDDIEIRKSRFYDNTISGYYSIDAGSIIKDDNDFIDNMGGIYTAASYPFGSYTYVGELGANSNTFYDNFYAIFSNATDKRQGLKVINNEFFQNYYAAMGARGAHILRFQENYVEGGNGLSIGGGNGLLM